MYGPTGESYVHCTCGCGDKEESAVQYYYGLKKCSKGGRKFVPFALPVRKP